jgi:hypothetical protein
MKRKLTLEEIEFVIKQEDMCGVQNLIQYILSDENAKTGLDVIAEIEIENGKELIGDYEVTKGTTIKVQNG